MSSAFTSYGTEIVPNSDNQSYKFASGFAKGPYLGMQPTVRYINQINIDGTTFAVGDVISDGVCTQILLQSRKPGSELPTTQLTKNDTRIKVENVGEEKSGKPLGYPGLQKSQGDDRSDIDTLLKEVAKRLTSQENFFVESESSSGGVASAIESCKLGTEDRDHYVLSFMEV